MMRVWLLSVCRVHRAWIENREACRKTKIGMEVAHCTRDSDTILSRSKGQLAQGGDILWRPPASLLCISRAMRLGRFALSSECFYPSCIYITGIPAQCSRGGVNLLSGVFNQTTFGIEMNAWGTAILYTASFYCRQTTLGRHECL